MSGLAGKAILITRPTARAGRLAELVCQAGGEPVLFPTLEILSTSEATDLKNKLSDSNMISADIAIFVSPTAVEQGLSAFSGQWPATTRVAAVGHVTARTLRERGFDKVIAPEAGADSEALAALPDLQDVADLRILIIRGEGGRAWLGNTLRARGARVDYVECYRRVCPRADAAPLAARWREGRIDALTLTSREALDNLIAMLPADCHSLALATPLFAVHERLAAHARALGAARTIVTGAGDEAMIRGMQAFFAKVA